MKRFANLVGGTWHALIAVASKPLAVAMSNRGVSTLFLLLAVLLMIGPWMRPSVSRDVRGIHIPWSDSASAGFGVEQWSHAPRPWRWDSVAAPMLAVAVLGIVIVWARPRWAPQVFGLLLALSIPALAAALWNHPGLYEFLEGEVGGRAMVRTTFRHSSEDLMTVRAPDRLMQYGIQTVKREGVIEPKHAMLAPLDYLMYPAWLIPLSIVGYVATSRETLPRRLGMVAAWSGAGAALALAATWPRLVAEYRWAEADKLERMNRVAEAEVELDRAKDVMRCLGDTRRYWTTRGRLAYRQRHLDRNAAFFLATQYLNAGDIDRARAELAPFAEAPTAAIAERDLMSEILGNIAATNCAHGQIAAGRVAWSEAVRFAPWKPAYRVGLAAAQLSENPDRAGVQNAELLVDLANVGDCFVASDVASALGDAYFETGDFHRAREMYAEAMRLFHLPKYVNIHAQEGRLGL